MNDRGQIQFDFAIGVSIFVVVILVAFTLVPGLFSGVTEGRAQGDQVAADRVSSWLVEEGFEDPSRPGTYDSNCVLGFFQSSTPACGHDGSSVEDNVPVDDRNVQVSLVKGSNVVCWDSTSTDFEATSSCSPKLVGDGEPGEAQTVATATRPVSIDGFDATVVVRVW